MNDLNEIDFADAAIHRLQRMGASDDYEKYVAEIEAHEKQQNTLKQLQRQREQLAEQMAQISLQMEELDNQIRDIQEVAQAPPPAEPQAEDPHLARAKELYAMNDEEQDFHMENLAEYMPETLEKIMVHFRALNRAAAPEAYDEVTEVAERHNDSQKRLAKLEQRREALVRQTVDVTNFTEMDQLQKQITEIDKELLDFEDQEPEADEEIALHLGSVRRRANPEPYQELSEHFKAQEQIGDLERQRETLVKQIPHAESFEAQNELQRQIQEIDIELNDFSDPEPIEKPQEKVKTNDKISNRTASGNDNAGNQKSARAERTKPGNADTAEHTDKANGRIGEDRKRTSQLPANDHKDNKTSGSELPPLSQEAQEELEKLRQTTPGTKVARSTVRPKQAPDFKNQEVCRRAIESWMMVLQKLLKALFGFGSDPMERRGPPATAGPGGPRM